MHGLIFFFMQKFSEKVTGGSGVWDGVRADLGLRTKSYSPVAEYDDAEAFSLLGGVAAKAGRPVPLLLEQFGEFLAPQLIQFSAKLIRPEWRTLDLIANTEEVIHTFVRHNNPGARPPVLQCVRGADDEAHLIYGSQRQLCSLAKGIIRGIAHHYKETVELTEMSCMLHGAPFCTIQIRVVADKAGASPSSGVAETVAISDPRSGVAAAPSGSSGVGVSHPPTVLSAPPGAFDARLLPDDPHQVAQYRILGRLGAGGMGRVYLAEDSDLQRRVALKVMHPHLANDSAARQRFLREARAAAAIQHDHVVTIFQVGQQGDSPFIAMQLLEGTTLEGWLSEKGQPPLAEALRVGREVAAGLAAAHRLGLMHRDVKPDNIWLEAPGGRVKLLDFGLARTVADAPNLTGAGLIVGTPAYMSPEQAASEPCDARSDLFSLGIILYRLCGGQLPFQGKSTLATLIAIANHQQRPLEELKPDLPPDLVALINQLLQKKPEDRPVDATAVQEALRTIAPA